MSSTPAWESCKENAAPLQRGRKISDFERATSAGGLRARPKDAKQQIGSFENLVQPSEDPEATEAEGDPLQHWLAYIKFYQDAFPADTHEQFLLMERCTRALVKMPQYANDDRFIGVCAKYADKTKEPAQVFKYLHQQRVGSETALFWAAWAFVAEKQNDFPFAEQIYKKGISKNAQPMKVLKDRHKQFQRRMSRLWLNNSHQNDQLDEYEEESTQNSRSALGGLSRDRFRRNQRGGSSRTAQLPGRRNPQLGQPSTNSNSNSISRSASGGAFSIFIEPEGENTPNVLDAPILEQKRVIDRRADRIKENNLEAERWNERGGLLSNRAAQARPMSRPSPAPFAVFVDEECEVQHEQEKQQKRAHAERQREVRDERTFRERSDVGIVERLERDPLRYVKDRQKLENDVAPNAKAGNSDAANAEKKSRVGFNKKLLKNANGKEQAFEEERACTGAFKLAPPTVNFNLLQRTTEGDLSSQMELDDGTSIDVSMAASSPAQSSVASQPLKICKTDPGLQARVLFRSEPSFDGSANVTAISTASSAVESTIGRELRKRENETINTKLAVRELSMMFSSPAFGVDEMARRTERQAGAFGESEFDCAADTSIQNVGECIANNSILDNSIMNFDGAENGGGPLNPNARTHQTPGFDKMALQELESTDEVRLGCSTQRTRARLQQQDDPLRGPAVPLSGDPGFSVYEDEESSASLPPQVVHGAPSSVGFSIFEDTNDDEENKQPTSSTFTVFEDGTDDIGEDKQAVSGNIATGFTIFEDSNENEENNKPVAGSGFAVFEDGADVQSDNKDKENGDTATLSLFGDVVDCLQDESVISVDNSEHGRPVSEGAGDTATMSIMNEIFQDLSSASDDEHGTKKENTCEGAFSIFRDGECDNSNGEARNVLGASEASFFVPMSNGFVHPKAIDYETTHSCDIQMALRRLQASASVASDSRAPLPSLLSTKGKCFHLPHIVLPREFRSKHLNANTGVKVGKHTGVINRELGRGAYGVVVLLETRQEQDQIAIKAQSPIDCLAWEFEVLKRLEQRTALKDQSPSFEYPRPLTFLGLADGGILSMSAGSSSGLNLVDLSNIYKLRMGEPVPELIVLHYTSRMLRHIERLHWNGNILHCDVKPDNFVLTSLDCTDNPFGDIELSDLMLVDFGRAIDLEQLATDEVKPRRVLLKGEASQGDMKCVAIREGKHWSYDIDTFGVLACAHVLLFGSHIVLKKCDDDRWGVSSRFKRYWQKDLWERTFDTLLNLDSDTGVAIGSRPRNVRALRVQIESYLSGEGEKLRSLLRRQVSLFPTSRDNLK